MSAFYSRWILDEASPIRRSKDDLRKSSLPSWGPLAPKDVMTIDGHGRRRNDGLRLTVFTSSFDRSPSVSPITCRYCLYLAVVNFALVHASNTPKAARAVASVSVPKGLA